MAHNALLESSNLISRKIWVKGKSWNFHTVISMWNKSRLILNTRLHSFLKILSPNVPKPNPIFSVFCRERTNAAVHGFYSLDMAMMMRSEGHSFLNTKIWSACDYLSPCDIRTLVMLYLKLLLLTKFYEEWRELIELEKQSKGCWIFGIELSKSWSISKSFSSPPERFKSTELW